MLYYKQIPVFQLVLAEFEGGQCSIYSQNFCGGELVSRTSGEYRDPRWLFDKIANNPRGASDWS